MPCELLSSLANCLLNETIFKIVEGLTEIQQVTEKQLLQQRLQLLHKHKGLPVYMNHIKINNLYHYKYIFLQLKKKTTSQVMKKQRWRKYWPDILQS